MTEARGQLREARTQAGLRSKLPELMLVTTDVSGCLVYFNTGCEVVTGYRRSDVLGLPLIQLLVPEAWQAAMAAHVREASDKSQMHAFRCPWRIRSGDERMIEWRHGGRELGTPTQLVFGIGIVIE